MRLCVVIYRVLVCIYLGEPLSFIPAIKQFAKTQSKPFFCEFLDYEPNLERHVVNKNFEKVTLIAL